LIREFVYEKYLVGLILLYENFERLSDVVFESESQ